MEKLIELLNEYEKEKESGKEWQYTKSKKLYRNGWSYTDGSILLISKPYGFIKWLVDNDKIDIKALCNKELEIGYDIDSIQAEEDKTEEERNRFFSDLAIMLLSISDNPIDDLISYLK